MQLSQYSSRKINTGEPHHVDELETDSFTGNSSQLLKIEINNQLTNEYIVKNVLLEHKNLIAYNKDIKNTEKLQDTSRLDLGWRWWRRLQN